MKVQAQILFHAYAIEEEYKKQIKKYFDALSKIYIKNITTYIKSHRFTSYMRLDAVSDDVEEIKKKSDKEAKVALSILLTKISIYAKKLNKFNYANFTRALRILDAKKPNKLKTPELISRISENIIKMFISINVNLIKSISNNLFDKLQIAVYNAFITGSTSKELAKEILAIAKVSEKKANFIARDQITKLNGQLAHYRSREAGIENYIWLTAQDERVRESHAVLHNKVCNWSDSTIYKHDAKDKRWYRRVSIGATEHQVGQDYGCRCVSIAIVEY